MAAESIPTADDVRRIQATAMHTETKDTQQRIDAIFASTCKQIAAKAEKNMSLRSMSLDVAAAIPSSLLDGLRTKFVAAKYGVEMHYGLCTCKHIYVDGGFCSCGAAGQEEGFPCSRDCSSWVKSRELVPHADTCASRQCLALIINW